MSRTPTEFELLLIGQLEFLSRVIYRIGTGQADFTLGVDKAVIDRLYLSDSEKKELLTLGGFSQNVPFSS